MTSRSSESLPSWMLPLDSEHYSKPLTFSPSIDANPLQETNVEHEIHYETDTNRRLSGHYLVLLWWLISKQTLRSRVRHARFSCEKRWLDANLESAVLCAWKSQLGVLSRRVKGRCVLAVACLDFLFLTFQMGIPIGSLLLARIRNVISDEMDPKKFRLLYPGACLLFLFFFFLIPVIPGRTYYFEATDRTTAQSWITAIKKASFCK